MGTVISRRWTGRVLAACRNARGTWRYRKDVPRAGRVLYLALRAFGAVIEGVICGGTGAGMSRSTVTGVVSGVVAALITWVLVTLTAGAAAKQRNGG